MNFKDKKANLEKCGKCYLQYMEDAILPCAVDFDTFIEDCAAEECPIFED